VSYVSEQPREPLLQFGLYSAVRAIQYGIPQSHYHFFAMLELYNRDKCTFLTPSGELGFAFHEIYKVSGLLMGEMPYEEYIPGTEELHVPKNKAPQVYETYWELLCPYHICAQITGLRAEGVKQMSWANYLSQDLGNKTVMFLV